MKYKLLAIDLDGTLLSKLKHISNRNLKAIKRYVDAGGTPVITTGRSIVSAMKFADEINKHTHSKSDYIIAFNGSYIRNLKTNELVSYVVPHKIAKEILSYAESHKMKLWAYTKEATNQKAVYVRNSKWNWLVEMGRGVTLLKIRPSVNLTSYKINLMSFSKKKIAKAYEWLLATFPNQLNISYSAEYLLEINLVNVNKGTAVQYVAKKMGLQKNQLAAIGDTNNDLPALQTVGLPIAVKTKSGQLRKAAKHYLHYRRNAVADAIDHIILEGKKPIKLIASDLDGTLLENHTKKIVPSAADALEKAVDYNGTKLVLCTGRGVDDCLLALKSLKIKNINNLFVIAANGTCIYDCGNDRIIYRNFISNELVHAVYTDMMTLINSNNLVGKIGAEIYPQITDTFVNIPPQPHYWINRKIVVDSISERHSHFFKNNWAKKKDVDIINDKPLKNILKFVFNFTSKQDRARAYGILEKYKFDLEIISSNDFNIEVMPPNTSKGKALIRLSQYIGIDIQETMPIGDECNDISMLELSRHSVTLKSANESVRKAAAYVIDAAPSHVVAEAVERFVLE